MINFTEYDEFSRKLDKFINSENCNDILLDFMPKLEIRNYFRKKNFNQKKIIF